MGSGEQRRLCSYILKRSWVHDFMYDSFLKSDGDRWCKVLNQNLGNEIIQFYERCQLPPLLCSKDKIKGFAMETVTNNMRDRGYIPNSLRWMFKYKRNR